MRSIAKKGLEYVPGVYHNLTKRVKSKTLKRILNLDAAHLALNKAIKIANQHLETMFGGITNLEIDKLFENEDIKKNYMGVHSIDSITRYIKFYII